MEKKIHILAPFCQRRLTCWLAPRCMGQELCGAVVVAQPHLPAPRMKADAIPPPQEATVHEMPAEHMFKTKRVQEHFPES